MLKKLAAACLAVAVVSGTATASAQFTDTPSDSWYSAAVDWATESNIIPYASGRFRPDNQADRKLAALWMWRMEGSPEAGTHPFTDVPAEADAAVAWMVSQRITTGTSSTTFAPNAGLTRAQVAAFLWRLAGSPPVDQPHSFDDVHADWQHQPVSWLAASEITTGTSATTFSPDIALTRAQLVTFLWRYFKHSEAVRQLWMRPGEGSSVTMGRADWSTGYFQAQVYKQLLEELGYSVSEPSEKELGPSLAFLGMAQGEIDFWANSWYPAHAYWLARYLPDGSTVGDHLIIVGNEMIAGGLQGFLITKSFADEHGVTHLDQLNDDPDILAAFDADDVSAGDGVADIYGCPESWTCDNIIDSQIAFSGWTNIAQVKADYGAMFAEASTSAAYPTRQPRVNAGAGYDAMFAEATARADAGRPMVIYTWTPSAYITQLRPGDNVVWLAMEDVLDDSNPTGLEGGEGHDQRPGQANIGADACPAAVNADNCQLGWVAADIQVTANTEWLNDNPYAAELLCRVTLSVIDVSLANAAMSDAGDDATEDFIAGLAADWISDNRDQVDEWLGAARMAPMAPSCPDTVMPPEPIVVARTYDECFGSEGSGSEWDSDWSDGAHGWSYVVWRHESDGRTQGGAYVDATSHNLNDHRGALPEGCDFTPWLALRCTAYEAAVPFFVDIWWAGIPTGTEDANPVTVAYRLDSGTRTDATWLAWDGDETYLAGEGSVAFVEQLSESQTMEFWGHDSTGTQVIEAAFDLTGIDDALEHLQDTCDWDSPMPPRVRQPRQPAGPSAWTPVDGENIRGQHVGAGTRVEISEYSWQDNWLWLFVRCTNRSALSIFFVLDDGFFGGSGGPVVQYRFGNQDSVTTAYATAGTSNESAFLDDPHSFLRDLRADTSGRLFVNLYDWWKYTDNYDLEGGGVLSVIGVSQHVEPVAAACGL